MLRPSPLTRRLRMCLPAWAAALLLGIGTANAAGPRAQDEPVRDALARNLTRIALMDLRSIDEAGRNDYRIATILLGIAHEQLPDDQDILRKYVEAAYSAGDERLVIDLTRRLLELEPEDSVAWLRLITASIATRYQHAEERLQAYEALLGEQGRGLDSAIRSRIALDAALLLRERGDERAFIEKLTLATQLDPAHKEAAALAANVVAASGQGSAATLEALSVLLMADPIDPNVHLAISRLLAVGGVFESARRFHRNAITILQAAGALSEQVLLEHRMLQWHTEGPGAVAESMSRELLVAQDAAARALRLARDARHPVDGMQRPEDVRLPLHMAALAVVAADAAGEDATAREILLEIAGDVERLRIGLREALVRQEIDEAQANRMHAAATLQVQTVRLWTGRELEQAAVIHEAEREHIAQVSPESVRLLDGWMAFRQDRFEEAIELLEPLVDSSALALLGIAMALEELGEMQAAVAQYERTLRLAPLEAAGAWARTRLLELGIDDETREYSGLDRIARGIPRYIDRMIARPSEFVQVSATAIDSAVGGLRPTRVRITIRNLSPIPLALGADRPINSRMLLSPKLDIENEGLRQLIGPEVIDLDRRLRLKPREVIEADVWPDPGFAGWVAETLLNRPMRLRWRVTQGFMIDRRGGYRPGPMSQATETRGILRRPLPEASISPSLLVDRIKTDPAAAMPTIAAAIRAELIQPLLDPTRDDIEIVERPGQQPEFRLRTDRMASYIPAVEALGERYPSLSPVHRAALVAIMPHAELNPFAEPFDQIARADNDPLVMSVVLVTRVTDPQDDYLIRAAESGDERLARLANAVAQRLERPGVLYARMSTRARAPAPGEAPRLPDAPLIEDIPARPDVPALPDEPDEFQIPGLPGDPAGGPQR